MTDHLAKQIRDKVVLTLDDGSALVSGKVFASFPPNGFDYAGELPAAFVFDTDEDSAPGSIGGATRRIDRVMQIGIHVVTKEFENLVADLDLLRYEIETRMAADPSLGSLSHDCWLSRTEKTFAGNTGPDSGGGQSKFASVRLTYTVKYATGATTPGVKR